MAAPALYIVAGPNGSGKSAFSKNLTESDFPVFDGDKHMTSLLKEFPQTGSEALWSYINDNIFKKEKELAISERLNYAFETNFSAVDPMSSVREFKANNYAAHLIFIGLNLLPESMERVAQRVRNGGHKVSEESIIFNYEHGYKNLYKYFRDFNSVTLYDNSIAEEFSIIIPKGLLYMVDGKIHISSRTYPDWTLPILDASEIN